MPLTQSGFTLVELITVMVLIGVLGAVAAPRFFERQSFDARAFSDQTQFMLRYAQKLAVAQGRPVYVRLDGASVALCFSNASLPSCASGNQVVPPAGVSSGSSVTVAACGNAPTWFCEGIPTGISYTLTPAMSYFYFDPLGKPFAAADVSPTLTSTFPTQLHIGIAGDGSTRDVIVESETGYVHL